jgi:hypothetical protein
MYGPALLPVLPCEPPVLNQSTIDLDWQILPAPGAQSLQKTAIPLTKLMLTTGDGTQHLPRGITVYTIGSDNSEAIAAYFSGSERDSWPELYSVEGAVRVQLSFAVQYAEAGWYEFSPLLHTQTITPRTPVRFIPRRDHDYDACMVPFSFMPVR